MRTPLLQAPKPSWRYSIFWKVAGILVGAQMITGVIAVGITVFFGFSQGVNLVRGSIHGKLNQFAEEIEHRALLTEDEGSSATLPFRMPLALALDMQARFKDPIYILNTAGQVVPFESLLEKNITSLALETTPFLAAVPENARSALQNSEIRIEVGGIWLSQQDTWALVPLVRRDSQQLMGGVLITPLKNTIDEELAGVLEASYQALGWVLFISGIVSLLIGGLLTWRLVTPLRHITKQVEAIGAGDYDARLSSKGQDELARLAGAVNQMANAVSHSVEALKTTDRIRRELVANIGHDLRTPVTAVLGYIEEVVRLADKGQREAARSALETAKEQTLYLKRMVADLFELSLFDSGQPPLYSEPIPMGELLHEAARGHQKAFTEAGVALHLDLKPPLPILSGDGLRMLRVIGNLLSNALRHTGKGGAVWLRAILQGESLEISVKDTGEGIAPDLLPHIFERYYRGGDARTRGKHGTGLGLAICKAVVEAHGGQIQAESTLGQGAVFTIWLPAPMSKPA